MKQKTNMALVLLGFLAGAVLSGPATQAAAGLMANPSSQSFYLGDRMIDLEAYSINGNNYVKLRDVGQAVGFGVDYDAASNSVIISPDKPYTEEVKVENTEEKTGGLSKNADGSINVPQDGSLYTPQAGDVIRCDDGTNYTITDVSRYDKNMFASGPVGPLPEPTCDWSQFDQPELPKAEVRRFTDEYGDYILVRNLYESRRILYTFYNAMGENSETWQNGQAVRRGDGSPWIHIQMTTPDGKDIPGFWPWRSELVVESLEACPGGTFYIDCWDTYRNGIFLHTEYILY